MTLQKMSLPPCTRSTRMASSLQPCAFPAHHQPCAPPPLPPPACALRTVYACSFSFRSSSLTPAISAQAGCSQQTYTHVGFLRALPLRSRDTDAKGRNPGSSRARSFFRKIKERTKERECGEAHAGPGCPGQGEGACKGGAAQHGCRPGGGGLKRRRRCTASPPPGALRGSAGSTLGEWRRHGCCAINQNSLMAEPLTQQEG